MFVLYAMGILLETDNECLFSTEEGVFWDSKIILIGLLNDILVTIMFFQMIYLNDLYEIIASSQTQIGLRNSKTFETKD